MATKNSDKTDHQNQQERSLLDDCFLHDKDRLKHADALELIKTRVTAIATQEKVDLKSAIGRTLAENISSPRNIPLSDNSAVDGYAFAHSDHADAGGFFPITARIKAGDTTPIDLPQNSAARIFTGATMPQGADSIAMQEDCETHEQDGQKFIIIPAGLKQGANRRKAGEDVTMGDEIAHKGQLITPALLSAIASTGTDKISIFKKLKIGIISTGSELRDPGMEIEHGQVYDSNRFMLMGLMENLPVEIIDYKIIKDDVGSVEATLSKAAKECDAIISSGGASKGEEDHVISSLEKLGKRHLWQLAVKPGRPMSFGQIGETPFFGLPGNPVACFVCFLLYVRQAILLLGGRNWQEPEHYMVPAGFDIPSKKIDRREFWRGRCEADEKGLMVLQKFERDGSGLITGLRQSDGLIEVAEDIAQVKKGDLLPFIPFSQFGA